jgi:hypothetical protein
LLGGRTGGDRFTTGTTTATRSHKNDYPYRHHSHELHDPLPNAVAGWRPLPGARRQKSLRHPTGSVYPPPMQMPQKTLQPLPMTTRNEVRERANEANASTEPVLVATVQWLFLENAWHVSRRVSFSAAAG